MGGSDSDSFHLDVSGALDAMNVPSLDKCDQITDVGFIFLVLNAIIGTGVLSFGEKFRNGVILSLIKQAVNSVKEKGCPFHPPERVGGSQVGWDITQGPYLGVRRKECKPRSFPRPLSS